MRQIGAFQPLRRDCAKVRDRRVWIVSNGRAAVFLSYMEVKSHQFSEFQKVCTIMVIYFKKIHDLSTLRADCGRLRDHRILKIMAKRRAVVPLCLIEAEVTPGQRFYELWVSRNLLSKLKNRELRENHGTNFFNLWEYLWFDRCFSSMYFSIYFNTRWTWLTVMHGHCKSRKWAPISMQS